MNINRMTIMLVAATLAATCVEARADDASELSEGLLTYFDGEYNSAWLWGGVGLGTAGLGVALVLQDEGPWRPMSYPVFAVSGIQLTVAIVMLVVTPPRVRKFKEEIADDAAGLAVREKARMAGVLRSFMWVEIIETLVIAGGSASMIAGAATGDDVALGVGAGLVLQGALMMLCDIVADERAKVYYRKLVRITPGVAALQVGREIAPALTVTGRF